jgi:hypothetical protein
MSRSRLKSVEKIMRHLVIALVALGVAAVPAARAERQCASPADQSAFEVQALRSELMVLAMGCHDDDRYNAFMRRYQPDLMANEKMVDGYFKRTYGRSAQLEHDRFVTDLANAVSRQGTELGSDFCPRNGHVFSEVMALRSPAVLAQYAAGKDLVPHNVDICTAPAPARAASRKPAKR